MEISHPQSRNSAAESVYVEVLTSSPPCQVNGLPGEGQRGLSHGDTVVTASPGGGSMSAVYSSNLYSESFFQLGNKNSFFYLNAW